ncbi:MAG: Cna B-type domain-containing protein, partial [Eubacteriales bacterium]
LRDNIVPSDTAKSDKYGKAIFPTSGRTLTPGMYLVTAKRHTQNGYYYDFAPFLVIITGASAVEVNAKFDSEPVPPEPVTVTRKVLKVWDDDGHKAERPKSITVKLLKNGVVYDTVVLSAKNNWRYTWNGLSSGSRWTVVEDENDNYTVDVTREGVTFVITNTYKEETPDKPEPPETNPPKKPTETDKPNPPDENPPKETKPPDKPKPPETTPAEKPTKPDKPAITLPQTGQLWWPVPLLLAAGLLFILIGMIRHRGSVNDER